MISNNHITGSNKLKGSNRVVAIARTLNGNNISHQMNLGQSFQLVPDQRNIKWLLENFFKNLFRGIA